MRATWDPRYNCLPPMLTGCTQNRCLAAPPQLPPLMGFSHGSGSWASSSLFLLFSILLLLLLSSLPSPSLSQPIQRQHNPPLLTPAAEDRLFHVMKPRPYPSDGAPTKENPRRRTRRRKSSPGDRYGVGTLSAMLPKGFVPPSGSSYCHNVAPDSMDDVCEDISSTSEP